MTAPEIIDEIKSCIEYWETQLFHHKFLMSPDVQYFVERTVKFLKELLSKCQ